MLSDSYMTHFLQNKNVSRRKEQRDNEDKERWKEDTSDILYLRLSSAYSKSTKSVLLTSFESTQTDANGEVDALKKLLL